MKSENRQTRSDVLPQNADVFVAVRTCLLVIETQSVEHLVLDSVVVNTAWLLQGQFLRIVKTADVGVAPTKVQNKSCYKSCKNVLFFFQICNCTNFFEICFMLTQQGIVNQSCKY